MIEIYLKLVAGNYVAYVRKDDQSGARFDFIENGVGVFNNYPTVEQLQFKGYKKFIPPVLENEWESFGDYLDTGLNITKEVKTLSPIEMRIILRARIYNIAKRQLDAISENYSKTEATRWEVFRKDIEAKDWSKFNAMAGHYITGQQFAELRVKPKLDAGTLLHDQIIGKRTDLLIILNQTLDNELINFDYKSIWDESSDYIAPPVESVEPTVWNKLVAAISGYFESPFN